MPPKKGGGGPSKKNQDKAKTKLVEDKTFGLKNKNKSKKVGEYVKSVNKQVKGDPGDLPPTFESKQKKKEETERLRMEQELFKPSVQQAKVPVGVDPKSVLCEFFKAGTCTKGDKCKFSHNLDVGRKAEKIDLYTDRREKEEDTMDNWDQDKLEKVVDSKFVPKKEDEAKKNEARTQIVCKYFLEAIESKKYGWFWECPNGGTKCMYQHKLPPGFILKSVAKEMEKDIEEIPLEDIIDEKRKHLTTRTPLTLESFLKWKEEKKKEKEAQRATDEKQKEGQGRTTKSMRSGREVFIYNPDLLLNDDDGDDVVDISQLPTEEIDGPSIYIEATGTSIRTIVRNQEPRSTKDPEIGEEDEDEDDDEEESNYKEGKEEEEDVQESLFREEDIPDEDEEDDEEEQ